MSEYIGHEEEYNGYLIRIIQDIDPQNPRTDYDEPIGAILGRKDNRYWTVDHDLDDFLYEHFDKWASGYADMGEILADLNKIGVAAPLYAYVHSGVALKVTSTPSYPYTDRWDGGQAGFVFCMKERAVAEWGKKLCTETVRERAIAYMAGEIEEYTNYINGNCWGYVICRPVEDEDGEIEWEETDESCWGFVGDSDESYMLEEARWAVDALAKHDAEQRATDLNNFAASIGAFESAQSFAFA